MLDLVHVGSSLSLRTFARFGSALALLGAGRFGSGLSVPDDSYGMLRSKNMFCIKFLTVPPWCGTIDVDVRPFGMCAGSV